MRSDDPMPEQTHDGTDERNHHRPPVPGEVAGLNAAQCDQTSIEGEQQPARNDPACAHVLGRVDVELVLLDQRVGEAVAVGFFRAPNDTIAGTARHGLSPCVDQMVEVGPVPLVNHVRPAGISRPGAVPFRVATQQEVRFAFLMDDAQFGGDTLGGVGVFSANDDDKVDLADDTAHFSLPLLVLGRSHRAIDHGERRVRAPRLLDETIAKACIVVVVEADKHSFSGHGSNSFVRVACRECCPEREGWGSIAACQRLPGIRALPGSFRRRGASQPQKDMRRYGLVGPGASESRGGAPLRAIVAALGRGAATRPADWRSMIRVESRPGTSGLVAGTELLKSRFGLAAVPELRSIGSSSL